MAKTKKKQSKKLPAPRPNLSEMQGLSLIAAALILLLSLLSFSLHGGQSHNWIGLVGSMLGWSCTALLGFGSYAVLLYLAWLGCRLLLKKPLDHLLVQTAGFLLALCSFCILLSLIEDQYPELAGTLAQLLHKAPFYKKVRFHLGGAPFYYLYRDLPHYNLLHLLNSAGVAILFSTTLLGALFFLTNLSLHSLARYLLAPLDLLKRGLSALWKAASEKRSIEPTSEELNKKTDKKPFIEEITPASQKKESSFLRYVKLRIPTSQTLSAVQPEASQNEMLAIQPETELKIRPSLSHKAQNEKPEKPLTLETQVKIDRKADLKKNDPLNIPNKAAVSLPSAKEKRDAALNAQRVHNGDFSAYKLPSLALLSPAKKLDHSLLKKDLKRKAEVLEETLHSFGIEAKVGQINCGPTITSFEVHPAIGVKVQRIKALENDIALNMEAQSIRIIAPIPGKAAVGIEVPNAQAEEVGFKDMLAAYQQSGRRYHIPILLGKAVNGDYVWSDLTKMPHCIIAGATGSGKSVCINTIVMSILLNAKPDEIKIVMVDPKKVELTPYTRLPHMLAPVITEPHGACAAMNWLVKEMEKRYDLLKQMSCRNIEAFNARTPDKEFEASLSIEVPPKLPYLVGIIDELADLMMVSSSDIETPIARIAQMARAVGIHLILATQRPSREVITGLIKANFPTRISFKVSSRVNSQIVLDDTGAEALLGNGDMLFLPPGSSHLVRAQGAFIRDEDINAVVKMICEQAPPRYVIESFDNYSHIGSTAGDAEDEQEGDALYAQALDIVCSTGNASTTFLQRKLKIGYARAASLIDMLEKKKIVGPAEGSKPRKLFVARADTKEENLMQDAFE
jgi:DNA segregation ATPase FtsK/SpoIIIE, S-DNA-T family